MTELIILFPFIVALLAWWFRGVSRFKILEKRREYRRNFIHSRNDS